MINDPVTIYSNAKALAGQKKCGHMGPREGCQGCVDYRSDLIRRTREITERRHAERESQEEQ